MPSESFSLPLLSGVVYTTLLNHRPQLAALGDTVHAAPYKAPPQHPVLGIKPHNTLAADGDALVVPPGFDAVEIGASLGLVVGRTACRVSADEALSYLAGYVLVNEVSLPRDSQDRHYRPSVRFMARDGYCPISATVVPTEEVVAPDDLGVRVWIDGVLVRHTTTGDRLRPVAALLADVTAFMTLQPGDVLTLGAAADAPLARIGQTVEIEIDGLGRLHHTVVAEGSAA
ncbi:fumarylacetoacetate hydrolase family protein [Sphaerotilus sp.]|uniref:fumarylacetoacetate hydrolase family protein n=1 Tax=Sphaerotilus sp. TaxID=2093942 RepID=UPI0034E25E3B